MVYDIEDMNHESIKIQNSMAVFRQTQSNFQYCVIFRWFERNPSFDGLKNTEEKCLKLDLKNQSTFPLN